MPNSAFAIALGTIFLNVKAGYCAHEQNSVLVTVHHTIQKIGSMLVMSCISDEQIYKLYGVYFGTFRVFF